MSRFAEVIDALYDTISTRRTADPTTSYTAQLLSDPVRAAKKLGEEGVEAALAGALNDRDGLIAESADVLYHLSVLWAARGVTPDDVAAALSDRAGVSGLTEKANRGHPDA